MMVLPWIVHDLSCNICGLLVDSGAYIDTRRSNKVQIVLASNFSKNSITLAASGGTFGWGRWRAGKIVLF